MRLAAESDRSAHLLQAVRPGGSTTRGEEQDPAGPGALSEHGRHSRRRRERSRPADGDLTGGAQLADEAVVVGADGPAHPLEVVDVDDRDAGVDDQAGILLADCELGQMCGTEPHKPLEAAQHDVALEAEARTELGHVDAGGLSVVCREAEQPSLTDKGCRASVLA